MSKMLVQLDPDRFIREVMGAIKTMPSEIRIRRHRHTHTENETQNTSKWRPYDYTHVYPSFTFYVDAPSHHKSPLA